MGKKTNIFIAICSAIASIFLVSKTKNSEKNDDDNVLNTDEEYKYESLFRWFRENLDMSSSDDFECLVAKGSKLQEFKQFSRHIGDKSLFLGIFDKKKQDLAKYLVVNASKLDKDIENLIGDKELIILE